LLGHRGLCTLAPLQIQTPLQNLVGGKAVAGGKGTSTKRYSFILS
jgi:hypothetical protein